MTIAYSMTTSGVSLGSSRPWRSYGAGPVRDVRPMLEALDMSALLDVLRLVYDRLPERERTFVVRARVGRFVMA